METSSHWSCEMKAVDLLLRFSQEASRPHILDARTTTAVPWLIMQQMQDRLQSDQFCCGIHLLRFSIPIPEKLACWTNHWASFVLRPSYAINSPINTSQVTTTSPVNHSTYSYHICYMYQNYMYNLQLVCSYLTQSQLLCVHLCSTQTVLSRCRPSLSIYCHLHLPHG